MESFIDAANLLPTLDGKLMDLLKLLSPGDWNKQTIAKLWSVKDVVAHLLDGNIRVLSMLRDQYRAEQANVRSYEELVEFLNKLNADWVQAMRRVSPEMLILLHEITGPLYCRYYKSLNPLSKAEWAVAWAGEHESKNWMHVAREYTEKWLHQQQIRDAVNKPALMNRDFYYPFIDIFMLGLPHTFQGVWAEKGTIVKVTVTSEIGGSWFIERFETEWRLQRDIIAIPAAEVIIDPDMSWKLFSKSLRPKDIRDKVTIHGDQELGSIALTMVSVMA